ncbi:hypothetical protein F4803DRAFT_578091 [Xylaria telfairii]|nr:hypothetical protein F4803DRAFT_578091 [Xylaria telfairii]
MTMMGGWRFVDELNFIQFSNQIQPLTMETSRSSSESEPNQQVLSADVEEKLLWTADQNSVTEETSDFSWVKRSLLFHGVTLLFFIILVIGTQFTLETPRKYGINLIKSPARDAVSYMTLEPDHSLENSSPFFRNASHEVDNVWNNLLKYSLSTAHWDGHTNSPGTLKGSQGESVLMLDVFRSLTCMNTIRKHLHRDYYKSDAPSEEDMNNCVDQVRNALMCHLDIAMGSYEWKEGEAKPWPNFVIRRECRDWDMLQDWAQKNSASSAMRVLVGLD